MIYLNSLSEFLKRLFDSFLGSKIRGFKTALKKNGTLEAAWKPMVPHLNETELAALQRCSYKYLFISIQKNIRHKVLINSFLVSNQLIQLLTL